MQRLRFADVEIQPDERRVLVGGRLATLGARAFDLLMCLLENRDRLVATGADPLTMSIDEFSKFIGEDIERWRKVVQAAGLKFER